MQGPRLLRQRGCRFVVGSWLPVTDCAQRADPSGTGIGV
jgi:hypothetical protein